MAEVNWGWGFESHKIEFNKKAAGNAAFLSRFAAPIQKQAEFQKSNQKRPKTAFLHPHRPMAGFFIRKPARSAP
ncbi:MAG: hypothetical protein ACTTJV_10635 [Ottowia sp.]